MAEGRHDRDKKGDGGSGSGDLFEETSRRISEDLFDAASGGRLDALAVGAVVAGAVDGILATDGDRVVAAKAILLGVLRATAETGDAGLKTVAHVARTAVRQAIRSEEDLAAVTKGLVLGAIAGAKGMGVELTQAASASARGALEGAEGARDSATETIRDALRKNIGGIAVELPRRG